MLEGCRVCAEWVLGWAQDKTIVPQWRTDPAAGLCLDSLANHFGKRRNTGGLEINKQINLNTLSSNKPVKSYSTVCWFQVASWFVQVDQSCFARRVPRSWFLANKSNETGDTLGWDESNSTDKTPLNRTWKLTLIRLMAATISTRLLGRATSRLPMYCQNKTKRITFMIQFNESIRLNAGSMSLIWLLVYLINP